MLKNKDFEVEDKDVKVFVSILSSNLGAISEETKKIEESGADGIHIDIMDGHFVKNLSMGPKIVETIKKARKNIFLDVHLMMYNPFDYVEKFISKGADMISFHFEATENIEDTIKYIKKCGKKAQLVFNPETSISMIPKYLTMCDSILFMSVNPGFSGQSFMEEVLEKIEFTRGLCNTLQIKKEGEVLDEKDKKRKKEKSFDIQVDGGIDPIHAKKCIAKGANILVSGKYVFSQKNMKEAIFNLKK